MAARKSPSAARFKSLYTHGFVRVAACAPRVAPADPAANCARIVAFAQEAHAAGAAVLLTPELSLTGYAIDDLFHQEALLDAAEAAIARLAADTKSFNPAVVVGAPLRLNSAVYNCAVFLKGGAIAGVVPKSFLPNYREYYEKRHFAVASDTAAREIRIAGQSVPFGAELLFAAADCRDAVFHVEICEDFWTATPPSTMGALAGATVLLNLSASNVVIGKAEDRKVLVDSQSRRCVAAYVFAASGVGESTTDLAWDGQVVAYEMGEKLAEGERFARDPKLVTIDIDVGRIAQERLRLSNFRDAQARHKETLARFRHVPFAISAPEAPLKRRLDRFPFVPEDCARREHDCYEAYNIQVAGLAKRIEATGGKRVVVGVSGGLDSTHALIVAARAFDLLGLPRKNIVGVTMPGFATGADTKANAWALMRALGVDAREVSIEPLAQQMLKDLNHPASRGEPVYDIAYENVQAGLRTDYLFRLANTEGGFVVGTGDLSELALGWCTYGVGDHMSHYNVNCGAPKTLIQHLLAWVAASELFGAEASRALAQVAATEISPELIPGETVQSTQAATGPYELQDFNLYWIVRHGLAPSKVLFLAWNAWREKYDYPTLRRWLEVFIARFFANQYKRSVAPNGPKLVSGGSLSPRGDWRAPSDAAATAWLEELRANAPDALD